MNELYLNKKALTKLVNAHLTDKEEQKIRTVVVAKRYTFFDEELHLEANYSRKLKAVDAPVNVNLNETDLTKIFIKYSPTIFIACLNLSKVCSSVKFSYQLSLNNETK